jgi:hypothetical protein
MLSGQLERGQRQPMLDLRREILETCFAQALIEEPIEELLPKDSRYRNYITQ